MTDEKQIEEMARILCRNNCTSCTGATCLALLNCKALYEHGYRKIPENAVVLTKEEYSDYLILQQNHEFVREKAKELQEDNERLYKNIGKFKDSVRKETAREILQFINDDRDGYWDSCDCGKDETYWRDRSIQGTLNEISKEYGVEVEE